MLANNDIADRVSQTIFETISTLMAQRGLETAGLDKTAKLVDTLGLKSMDIAEVVLLLEDELEIDPFQEIPITSVRTVGDLINAYLITLDPASAPVAETDSANKQPTPGVSRRADRRR